MYCFLCKCVLHYYHRVTTQLQLNILYHIIPYAFQTESCVKNGSAQLDVSSIGLFFVSLHPQKILPV